MCIRDSIESALDDPEHISLEGYPEELGEKNEGWKKEVETLLRNSEDGKIMTEGIRTVILGKPNAGKSSLDVYKRQEQSRPVISAMATRSGRAYFFLI